MNEVLLDDLIGLFNRAYPILPDTPEGDVRKAIDQFNYARVGSIQVICDPLEEWAQGDIIDPLIFLEWSDEGKPIFFDAPGMIITSTCDLDRKDNIVVCPCYSLSELSKLGNTSFVDDISKNTVFEFFYIDKVLDGNKWAVDLSRPMTLSRDRILSNLQSENIIRKHSLTDKGWYLFITKFSMKYFRPDDLGTMNQRIQNKSQLP